MHPVKAKLVKDHWNLMFGRLLNYSIKPIPKEEKEFSIEVTNVKLTKDVINDENRTGDSANISKLTIVDIYKN